MSRVQLVLSWDGSRPAEWSESDAYVVKIAPTRNRPRFGIHELVKTITSQGQRPDPRAFELVLVALAVWLADTRLSRVQHSQDNWTRHIGISVPVRNPDLWHAHASVLSHLLGTLSGDIWEIAFHAAPPAMTAYIDATCVERATVPEAPAVALFSGGLDSFVGAIDAFSREASPPIFVSQVDAGNSGTVDTLTDLLEAHHQKTCLVYRWAVSSRAADFGPGFKGQGELTMRARSFLFFVGSVLVATAHGSMRILVPENGFISLNVPLDPWRLGALTTRTTHPFVIARFNELLEAMGLHMRLENPFQALTKGEMLAQCADQGVLWTGLPITVSCSKPRFVRRYRAQFGASHCGTCWPCLIRRAAVQRAFPSLDDPTPYVTQQLSHLHSEPGPSGHVVRSLQYGLNMLRQPDYELRWTLASVAPLGDAEAQIPELIGCIRRGLAEVAQRVGLVVPK
ncbi:hypothetical protein AZ78_1602 [Lysobacter capsici AZ78]|uniref:7-cyano-7-deazaguanine synthase n=1 Tax=Lysobacter capsici AZ78 TaxID=1444315 RepID=A0A120AG55_9GAMM|nr:Qat anti-phage system QueC-like protein QatC [Lysobacter capsici]KWS04053.1 hypothetical protein AZ78_1602 [Lysobacter capsici AZ78]